MKTRNIVRSALAVTDGLIAGYNFGLYMSDKSYLNLIFGISFIVFGIYWCFIVAKDISK